MRTIYINNVKTKRWVLSIITILLQCWVFLLNPFRKNKITHLFFWSKKQDTLSKEAGWFDMRPKKDTYIKGKKYSEMREIGRGYSNWGDAIIVGIGGYSDVRHDNKKP
jgi:hypothetical protein